MSFMLKNSNFVKIRIAVPLDHAEQVRQVLGETGAGVLGNYEFTSGSWLQTGRFRPKKGAYPAIGKVGVLEEVVEEVQEAEEVLPAPEKDYTNTIIWILGVLVIISIAGIMIYRLKKK